ncbi:MAG: phage minor capsid protein [Gordonibacter pamelaeae]
MDTLLMEHRAKISETVMAEVRRTLLAADERRRGHSRLPARLARGRHEARPDDGRAGRRRNTADGRAAERRARAPGGGGVVRRGRRGIRYAEAGAMPKGWIDKAVVRLADAGVKTVDYRSGTSSQVDVAIKRHMRTQVNQAAGRRWRSTAWMRAGTAPCRPRRISAPARSTRSGRARRSASTAPARWAACATPTSTPQPATAP